MYLAITHYLLLDIFHLHFTYLYSGINQSTQALNDFKINTKIKDKNKKNADCINLVLFSIPQHYMYVRIFLIQKWFHLTNDQFAIWACSGKINP